MSDINIQDSTILTKVTAFFIKLGSQDLPFVYDPDSAFGFDTNNPIPIYTASMTSLQNGFVDLVNFEKPSVFSINGVNTINKLFVEGFENEIVKTQDTESDGWKAVFKILEAIFDRQTSVITGQPTIGTDYISYADELLASQNDPDNINNPNPYYTGNYTKGSIVIEPSSHTGRVPSFSFRALVNGTTVEFLISFDPDKYLRTYRQTTIAVWSYYDSDGNREVSDEEMKDLILQKTVDIVLDYKVNRTFLTFVVPEYKPIDANTWVYDFDRVFYIYTNLDDPNLLTVEQKKEAIKKWLLDIFNGDRDLLVHKYPSLFSNDLVVIIPVYDNLRNVPGGTTTAVQPLDLNTLGTVLTMFGYEYNYNLDSYRPTEIILTGMSTQNPPVENQTKFSCITVDQSEIVTSNSYPISSRFPNYEAKSFNREDDDPSDSDDDRFQFFLIRTILYHVGALTYEALTENLTFLDWTLGEDGTRPWVSFKFASIEWKVYGLFDI